MNTSPTRSAIPGRAANLLPALGRAAACLAAVATALAIACTIASMRRSSPVYAQQAQQPKWAWAEDYATYSYQGANNIFTFPLPCLATPNNGSQSFFPFGPAGAPFPLLIADQTPSNSEIVHPSSTSQTGAGCGFQATAARQHTSFTVRSGTSGLQEAVTALSRAQAPMVVFLDAIWYAAIKQLPGSPSASSLISALKGSAQVNLVDTTQWPWIFYNWNGTQYVAAQSGSVGPAPPPAVAIFTVNNNVTGSTQWTAPGFVGQSCAASALVFETFSCLAGAETTTVDTSFESKAPFYTNWQFLFGGSYSFIGNGIGSKSTHALAEFNANFNTDQQAFGIAVGLNKKANGEAIPYSANCLNMVGGGSNGMEYPCEGLRLQFQQFGDGDVLPDGSGGAFNATASNVAAGVVTYSTPTNSPHAIGTHAFVRDLGTGSKKAFPSNNYSVTVYATFLGATTYGVNNAVLGGTDSGLTNGSFTVYDDNILTDSPCAVASGSFGGTGAVITGHVTGGVIDSWALASSGCYKQNSTLPAFHFGTATFTLTNSTFMNTITMFRVADASGANFSTSYGAYWTSSANGLPGGAHMTYGNYASGSQPVTENMMFCPSAGAATVTGGSFDGCLPIWYSDSTSSFVIALQFTGQPNDGSYPWASVSTGYTLYTGAMVGALGGFTGTAPSVSFNQFSAGIALPNYITNSSLLGPTLLDASGITQGDTIDTILGYNVDFISLYTQYYKPIGRTGGGIAEFQDDAQATGWPGFGFGFDFVGKWGTILNLRCSLGTRCPTNLAALQYEPPAGTDQISDSVTSTNTVSYVGANNSTGVHTSMLNYNKATSTEALQGGNFTVDAQGNTNVLGRLGSINGGFGMFSNLLLDSLFQNGTGNWANFTLGGGGNSGRTANSGADPFGHSTAVKMVAPTLAPGQYSGFAQTTSVSMQVGQFYAVSITLRGLAGGETMVLSMTGNPSGDTGCAAGPQLNLPSVFHLTTSNQTFTFWCTPTINDTLVIELSTITGGATWFASQAEACSDCISTGTQVITTSSTVTGNGFVNNGIPMFQLYTTSPATIPTCSSVLYGALEFAGDGTATPSLLAAYSGGGSTNAPIFCNGSGWVYY